MAIHIPKGEGIKIIKQYSEATTNDSIYILPIDGKYAEMIIVDKVGGKRKVGFSLPENLALHDIVNSDGEITTQGNTYLKTQIDTLLNIERTSREGKDAELEMEIQSETRARESKDNELKTAIETEQQERIAKDAEINETISTINNELNSEKTTREQADISLDGKIDNLKSIVESLSDWKNLMVNEDADAIINTITEVVSAFRNLPEGSNVLELLNAKVNISSIVNNLESEIENVPLSAKQGKILKDLINDTKALLEQSNTTQDTAISGKLDKTTATISEPNAEFKYAYLTNEGNETRRMLAGDLGKNVANSKPTSVAGAGLNMAAIWDIDTNGFPLRIKGLPDKSADTTFNKMRVQDENGVDAWSNGKPVMENLMASLPDATGDANAFNIYPVYNAVTNKLAKSVRPQVITNFNVPANIQITHSFNSPGFVINPKPEYSEDLKNALNKIKEIQQLGFTKVRKDELIVKTMEEQFFPDQAKGKYSFPTNLIEKPEDGCFIFNGFGNLVNYITYFISIQHTNYLDNNNAKAFYNVFINKEMPSDRDWIVKLRTHNNGNNYSTGNKGHSIGLRSDITTYADFDFNSTFVKFGGYGAVDTSTLFAKATNIFGISLFTEIYFIKQGSLIITLVLDIQANRYTMEVNTYEETYKKLYFYINPNYYGTQQGQVIFKDISYWIQP